VRLPKKINMHLGQKVPIVLACFQVSAPPRLENPDSDKKDALVGLNTQITILDPLMKRVILRTHKRTKSNSFSDALFLTLTVAPSVGLFSKLATKPIKPKIVLLP
jgi:hypothetical protein